MVFNSMTFAVFLVIVFALYWSMRKAPLAAQNLLLIVASYTFYGWWDYRFLSLIVVSSATDYVVGLGLGSTRSNTRRKVLLLTSLAVNLGILGFFKYFDFFIESFAVLLSHLGMAPNLPSLRLILPVGISFYTFQTLSYTIDVYRRQIEPTKNVVSFFAFVSFFPQLVAGPIERAKSLLPQFDRPRQFDERQAVDGLRQMLWGMMKKVVIADNLAPSVERIFASYSDLDGLILIIGAFFFAMQIYCDFSGYSDIAIGTARLFGFELRRNFAYPYFSRDIAEFWRRWHISLSSWFRDYVFIPLGGSRASTPRRIANILVTFAASGLWHGANWTFVVWGLLNGIYYLPLMLTGRQKRHSGAIKSGRLLPTPGEFLAISSTFGLTLFAWVFFRSDSISSALGFLHRILTHPLELGTALVHRIYLFPVLWIFCFLAIEWVQRDKPHVLQISNLRTSARWGIYLVVSLAILLFGNFDSVAFIYFQF